MNQADKKQTNETEDAPTDFIRDIVKADIVAGKPAPVNGYLHIGHAKSICLNFGIAEEFFGRCNLRLDDTNPVKEEEEFADAILADLEWLGFDWGEELHHASDYFQQLYDWARYLVENGDAYVDDLSADEMREYRGTLTEPGRDSPHRDRTPAENLELLASMRAGEFEDGAKVLRARIDMASGNINLRDPVLYRIRRATHARTGDEWCIYPTYDFAHGQSDAIEGISHSICTLEFEDHRPLYDWLLEKLPVPAKPHQYEFARLNLSHTVLSKRLLTQLVSEGHVAGWDDPRLPTLSGLRRRGMPPAAIREFATGIGVAKAAATVEMGFLEHCVREELNRTTPRRMAVLDPIRLVIETYPEGEEEILQAANNPRDEEAGTRGVAFSRNLYIERGDFMEDPPKKFFRLAPGREVRLRSAYFVTCMDVIKDENGRVVELRCSHDQASRGGKSPDGRKVKATLHWVSADHALDGEIRIYHSLFNSTDPMAGGDFLDDINPGSLEVLEGCKLEPSLSATHPGETVQFERTGYFCADPDGTNERPVFNRTVALRDSWAKAKGKSG